MKIIKRNLKLITIIAIIIIIITLSIIKYQLQKEKNQIDDIKEEELLVKEEPQKIEEPKKIHVDIKGEIKKPGVYEIEENKLVIDVINLAGGLTTNANTTLINLAKKVSNEMVIIIYTNEEVKKATENTNNNTVAKIIDKECICPNIKNDACINTKNKENTSSKSTNSTNNQKNSTTEENNEIIININEATKEELEKIPGIGSSKAESIIQFREENGLFKTIEDIKDVTGIGDNLYEKIKTYITV